MKSVTNIIGIIFIVLGITGYAYKYFTYTKNENIAQLGSIKITAQEEKAIFISPILSGACLVSGIILVFVSIRRK